MDATGASGATTGELAALELRKKHPGEAYSYEPDRDVLTIIDTVAVPAGDYCVELVSAGFNPSTETYNKPEANRFPLRFREKSVALEAGRSVRTDFSPLPYQIVRFPTPNATQRGYGQTLYVGELSFEKRHLTAYKEMVKCNWERYQREPIRLALEKIKDESPKGRVIMVPIPEAFGGARELDEVQIELIVDWLKDVYCRALTIGPERDPKSPSYANWAIYNPALKREAFDLMEKVDLKREEMDQLKAICRKLRRGPRRDENSSD